MLFDESPAPSRRLVARALALAAVACAGSASVSASSQQQQQVAPDAGVPAQAAPGSGSPGAQAGSLGDAVSSMPIGEAVTVVNAELGPSSTLIGQEFEALIEGVWSGHLISASLSPGSATVIDELELVTEVGDYLGPARRAELHDQLRQSYGDPGLSWGVMDPKVVCAFADASWVVGVPDLPVGSRVARMVLDSNAWRSSLSPTEKRVLLRTLRRHDAPEGELAQGRVVGELWDRYLSDPAEFTALEPFDLFLVTLTANTLLSEQQREQWARSYYASVVVPSTPGDGLGAVQLLTAGRSLRISRLTYGDGMSEFPAYVEAFVDAIGRGESFRFDFNANYKNLASPINTPVARRAVLAALQNAGPEARVTASKALTWAQIWAGNGKNWRQRLAGFANDPARSADDRATWLLALGYAQGQQRAGRSPASALPYLRRALELASGDEVKAVIAHEFADRYAQMRRYEDGAKHLALIRQGVTELAALREIDRAAFGLNAARYNDERYAERDAREQDAVRVRGDLASLRLRLEEAQAGGSANQALIDALDARVQAARSRLDELVTGGFPGL